MGDYPEHEKLSAVQEQSQAIGEFLDGCGYTLCKVMYHAPWNGIGALSDEPNSNDSTGRFTPVMKTVEQVLAEWFEIDREVLEKEKRAMLEALRKKQATHQSKDSGSGGGSRGE